MSTGVGILGIVLDNACGRLHAQGNRSDVALPGEHLVCVTIVCTPPHNLSVCVTLKECMMVSNGICGMSVTSQCNALAPFARSALFMITASLVADYATVVT